MGRTRLFAPKVKVQCTNGPASNKFKFDDAFVARKVILALRWPYFIGSRVLVTQKLFENRELGRICSDFFPSDAVPNIPKIAPHLPNMIMECPRAGWANAKVRFGVTGHRSVT
jgi:hypothetical protein